MFHIIVLMCVQIKTFSLDTFARLIVCQKSVGLSIFYGCISNLFFSTETNYVYVHFSYRKEYECCPKSHQFFTFHYYRILIFQYTIRNEVFGNVMESHGIKPMFRLDQGFPDLCELLSKEQKRFRNLNDVRKEKREFYTHIAVNKVLKVSTNQCLELFEFGAMEWKTSCPIFSV